MQIAWIRVSATVVATEELVSEIHSTEPKISQQRCLKIIQKLPCAQLYVSIVFFVLTYLLRIKHSSSSEGQIIFIHSTRFIPSDGALFF